MCNRVVSVAFSLTPWRPIVRHTRVGPGGGGTFGTQCCWGIRTFGEPFILIGFLLGMSRSSSVGRKEGWAPDAIDYRRRRSLEERKLQHASEEGTHILLLLLDPTNSNIVRRMDGLHRRTFSGGHRWTMGHDAEGRSSDLTRMEAVGRKE